LLWRPIAVLALLVAGALAVVGVTFDASSQLPADFRFVNGTEPRTLDPGLMTGEPESRIANELFEGLTRREARSLQPAPGVAERWEVSEDSRVYTFHLRADARWSDGSPVTAHDFAYAWRRLVDPATGSEYAYLLHGLRGARAFHAGDPEARRRFGVDVGVIARGDLTLVVELEAPIAWFLELTSHFSAYPVPRRVVEAHPRDWFLPGRIVSNGPFVLAGWRVGDRIRLARNPHYWGRDAVALATVDALPVESPTTALNLFLRGDVDWVPRLYPDELVDVLRERDDFYHGPGLSVYYFRLNTRRPPLDDPRVRQAIGLAIDRREITDLVLRLGQIPATAIVPPGMPGYRSPGSGMGFDVARARALLAEAGHAGGRGIRPIGILYNTHETHKKIAEVIADQLRRNLGIDVSAYNQEWQSYLASMRAGDYDIGRAGWIGDYLDPNTFLDIWITDGGNNQTGWGDPAYDALIAAAADPAAASRDPDRLLALAVERADAAAAFAAAAEADAQGGAARGEALAKLRLELLRQAEAILIQRGFPVVPIYFYVVSGLVSPDVTGFYPELTLPDGSPAANLQGLHPLREVRVRRGAGRG
jgi:oligopeptide transport system substrate-binding protein